MGEIIYDEEGNAVAMDSSADTPEEPAAQEIPAAKHTKVKPVPAGLNSSGNDAQGATHEAGGVAWVDLYGNKTDKNGITHQVHISVTSRDTTPLGALQELLATISVAETQFFLHPYPPAAPSLKQDYQQPRPVAATAPVQNAPAAAVPPAGRPEPQYIPAGADPKGAGTFRCTKMQTTPRGDGKTKADFFETGHRYPDISAVMNPEGLVELLKATGAWTVQHFQVAQEYQIAYDIQWQNSDRMNQNGRPYKNIMGISISG